MIAMMTMRMMTTRPKSEFAPTDSVTYGSTRAQVPIDGDDVAMLNTIFAMRFDRRRYDPIDKEIDGGDDDDDDDDDDDKLCRDRSGRRAPCR